MPHDPDTIYKALRPVPDFDGNPNVLTRFIKICDQIVITYVSPNAGSELANLCLINGILNKITGPAASIINAHGIPDNWLSIRNALINNFADQRDETTLYNDLSLSTQVNSDDVIQGQPLKIMKINYPDGMDNTASPHLNLSSINLRSLHTIQDKIMFKPQLQLQTIPDVLYHTTIPFYIILFGAAVLALAVLARRYYVWKNTQPKPSEKTICIRRDKATETTGNHIYAKPSSPAIFSLKVGK
ncbi:uncharacterized protein LOC113236966 [Hyposmocoma kahamanoa]|uniref:uncharacterized protein LOC113236966 n=1 Tax=Hyposmocoma kahamanoa TaxID=1477025 RepID=UPI000E6DA526|nr:uncharacterized protein LOC113236966 [Hyposmocoma kahamanoa]